MQKEVLVSPRHEALSHAEENDYSKRSPYLMIRTVGRYLLVHIHLSSRQRLQLFLFQNDLLLIINFAKGFILTSTMHTKILSSTESSTCTYLYSQKISSVQEDLPGYAQEEMSLSVLKREH